MQVVVHPAKIDGSVTVPCSKSIAHRAIICAALAEGESLIHNVASSMDIAVTAHCLRSFGAQITLQDDGDVRVRGTASPQFAPFDSKYPELFCGESGSALRFLIPLALLTGQKVSFTGEGLLLERPQTVYEKLFRERGIFFAHTGREITVQGRLAPGSFTLRGDVSSQFITGLLLVLPLLDGDSSIQILPPFESRSYVKLTLQTMAEFGVHAEFTDEYTLRIPGGQRYVPCETALEGDYSQAAFFAVLGAVTGRMECRGLRRDTLQGDAVITDIVRRFGGEAVPLADGWSFGKGTLTAREVDLADCPDLGPALMALAACAEGETTFLHTSRLRLKESDRAAVMSAELSKLGVSVWVGEDTVTVRGGFSAPAEGTILSSHNDHRIPMSLAVLAAAGSVPVRIDGAECVAKSYPRFWEDLRAAGVPVDLEQQGDVIDVFVYRMEPPTIGPGSTVLIVGLGLIGGAYARALSRQGIRVTAADIDPDAISYALGEGIIAAGAAGDPVREAALVREADLIVLSLYPSDMADWVLAHQGDFQTGTVLTDVSGVKRAILSRIQEELPPGVEFIGSHPMAGRELSGVRNSDDSIFRDANFIVTPTDRNTQGAIELAKELGRLLGFSRISVLAPEEHDRMIGYLSQLTHAIAVSLMNANDSPHLSEYTGDSFRDLTRIARINETLWSELFLLNKDILIPEIDSFAAALEDLKQKLAAGDEEGLKQLFRQSTARRKQFDRKSGE